MYQIVLFANVLVFGMVAWWYAFRPAASMYHPAMIYLLVHFIIFVVRPLFAFYGQFDFVYNLYQFHPSQADKITAILAANLSLVVFVVASTWIGYEKIQFNRSEIDQVQLSLMRGALFVTVGVLLPIGIYAMLIAWQGRSTGFEDRIVDAATGTTINTKGSGYLHEAQLLAGPCVVLLAWAMRFRLIWMLPIVGFMILRAGTGGRGPLVYAILMIGILYYFERRNRWPNMRSLVIGVLALAMFASVGNDRGRAIRSLFIDERSIDYNRSTEVSFMEGMDLANLEYLEYLVHTIPEKTGTYGYFLDNLALFTEPIPRVLWKDKPIGAPIKMYNLFDHGSPIGMTYSLPGNGWAQLGYLGVVIWSWIFGLFYGKFYNWFARGRQTNAKLAIYASVMSMSFVAFRDGGLVSIARFSVFLLAPAVLWLIVCRYTNIPSIQELAAFGSERMKAAGRAVRTTAIEALPRSRRPRTGQDEAIVPRSRRNRQASVPAE